MLARTEFESAASNEGLRVGSAVIEGQISQASPTGSTIVLIGMSVAAMESPVGGRSRDAERAVAAMFRNILMRSRGSRDSTRAVQETPAATGAEAGRRGP